jgi:hypothetical protein
MTAGQSSDEAQSFVAEAASVWERARREAQAGDENMKEWCSNLYTAISGHLLTGIHDVPNLRERNWSELLHDLGAWLIEHCDSVDGR